MQGVKIGLLAAGLLLAGGCATRGDLDSLQQDLEEMKGRTLKVEKELGGVRSEAREGLESNLKGFQKDIDSLRKMTADLQAAVDASKVDLQVMGGKVDDFALQAKKPADDLTLLREDVDRKNTGVEKRLEKIEKNLEELQKNVTELRSREAEKTPDAIYQKGIDAYKAGDFAKSREQLSRFIELFPKHELTANAHYWLGETYYSEKIYDQAILEFEKVVKEFPAKGKAPAALLKQAMAFKELDDAKSARFVYKKLIENYPLADEVKVAKEKLKELK
ncbi:tol-pal system protein YbgF [Geobacter pelophilus]|uniref:Tol-pal system protein YbgF n=1 Tax=Geoanaerobacter pelophilus TaxID=60036 RepID=A0AAW4L2B9_9BACT|nr:tol-pal system protein YbgF [Geoanaerobacter pelophilus]MBT0665023.1 tol-pal system protein YbgF [Geoanaerobacter pelophilus]